MSAEVGEVKYKVSLDDSGIESEAKKAESKITSSFGAGAKGVASGIGHAAATGIKMAAGAIAAGTTAVGAFATASIEAGKSFDASMAQVAATMGTTVDQIGDLRDFAQEMGSTTAFSATEAADALNYMALAGYDADTSMKMLPNVLSLAAAGNIDLAAASDMVTDAQTALGLSLDETSTMVDQMAKASSKSNTSVAQLGDAFLKIGANARNVKGGTQELSTVLGVLADNGIKGTEAGTHLRNIMLSLTPTTDKAAAAWEQLGVQAYDANGELRDLPTIFAELNTAMKDMTDQEKTETLSAMFNKTDLASIQALIGTTTERYEELSAAIEDSDGAAKAMADTQLDNLAGDITLFQSALEGAKIAVSDELTPTLRDFVKLGADGLGEVTKAFKEDGLSGAMDALGGVLSEGLTMVVDMIPDAIDAGMQLIGALGQGIMDNLDTIVYAAGDVVEMLLNSMLEATEGEGGGAIMEIITTISMIFHENYGERIDVGFQILTNIIDGITESLPQLFEEAEILVGQFADAVIENLPLLIESAAQLILQLATGIAEALPELIPTIVDVILCIVEALIDNIDLLIDAAIAITMGLAEGLINALPRLLEKAPEIIAKLIDALIENSAKLNVAAVELVIKLATGIWEQAPKIVEAAWKIIGSLIEGIGKQFTKIYETGGKIIEKIKEGLSKLNPLQWGKDVIDSFVKGILGAIDKVKETAKKVAQTVKDFLGFSEPEEGPLSNFHTFAPDMIDLYTKGMDDGRKQVEDSAAALASSVALGFDADVNYSVPDIAGYARDLSASITGTGRTVIEVPVVLDGREIARASAWYMGEQLAWEAR